MAPKNLALTQDVESHECYFEKLVIRVKSYVFTNVQVFEIVAKLLLLMFSLRNQPEVDVLNLKRPVLEEVPQLLGPHVLFDVDH